VEIATVFAAELASPQEPKLTWEHDQHGWFTAQECEDRLTFRGLRECLQWLRQYISEVEPAEEFELWMRS
jgi:hypothetical protein